MTGHRLLDLTLEAEPLTAPRKGASVISMQYASSPRKRGHKPVLGLNGQRSAEALDFPLLGNDESRGESVRVLRARQGRLVLCQSAGSDLGIDFFCNQ